MIKEIDPMILKEKNKEKKIEIGTEIIKIKDIEIEHLRINNNNNDKWNSNHRQIVK